MSDHVLQCMKQWYFHNQCYYLVTFTNVLIIAFKNRVKYLQGINFTQLSLAEKTVTKNVCCATPDLVIPQPPS